MIEHDSTQMHDGSVVTISKNGDMWTVAQYDRGDIEMWSSEFDNEDEAWTEYYKRTEQ